MIRLVAVHLPTFEVAQHHTSAQRAPRSDNPPIDTRAAPGGIGRLIQHQRQHAIGDGIGIAEACRSAYTGPRRRDALLIQMVVGAKLARNESFAATSAAPQPSVYVIEADLGIRCPLETPLQVRYS
jgi:hypothetical protein